MYGLSAGTKKSGRWRDDAFSGGSTVHVVIITVTTVSLVVASYSSNQSDLYFYIHAHCHNLNQMKLNDSNLWNFKPKSIAYSCTALWVSKDSRSLAWGHTPWKSGWVAILTILAPESPGKSWSLNCCETVHGIRSPDALLPRDRLFMMEDFEISPSRHTWFRKVRVN